MTVNDATTIDVQRGRTTLLDKHGNDGADNLAVAGAQQHAVDEDIVLMSTARRECAKCVHRMFVSIVHARMVQEQCWSHECRDELGDRGSDPGDCMELLDVACGVVCAASDTERNLDCTGSDNEHSFDCIDILDDELTWDRSL